MEIKDCIELAENISEKYNPNKLSPFPYQNIEKDRGDLKIIFIELPQGVSGAITFEKDTSEFIILINKDSPETRKHFTIAHELGHYFLHQEIIKSEEMVIDHEVNLEGRTLFRLDNVQSTRIETEANNFAASLIMPREQVSTVWKELSSIEECAKIFNVSALAMTIRLIKLGLIKE